MRYGKLLMFLSALLCLEGQAATDSQVLGPYTYENLSVFLIPSRAPYWGQTG